MVCFQWTKAAVCVECGLVQDDGRCTAAVNQDLSTPMVQRCGRGRPTWSMSSTQDIVAGILISHDIEKQYICLTRTVKHEGMDTGEMERSSRADVPRAAMVSKPTREPGPIFDVLACISARG